MIPRSLRQNEAFRFTIRPYDENDVAEVFAAVVESREHVGQWMGWLTEDYSMEDTEEWVRHAVSAWEAETDFEFLIIDREDGAIAGSCGVNEVSRKYLMGNLGYWVRASKLKLGAGRQAALLLRDFGFLVLGLNRLEIVVARGNEASQRVALGTGALYEGIMHQRVCVGDTVHDAEMYALLRRPA